MNNDILATVNFEIEENPLFALQLNVSTDIACCCQLLIFTRYINDDPSKSEYLLCKSLSTIARGETLFQTLKVFCRKRNGVVEVRSRVY